ncbi:MAG: aconitate hydratase AcnA [Acidobacteria bacterium]|nr:aconitate hydratase AcnA [Acidobacteriota bacterium]
MATSHDSFNSRSTLEVDGRQHIYYSLKQAEAHGLDNIALLPFSLKVLLENLLRHEDGRSVSADDIRAMALWVTERKSDREIAFRPARVLMQDFTGVPAVVDLAAMRDAMSALGGDPRLINPLARVDLVIDHSVMVDAFGTGAAFNFNVDKEYERNGERYAFLRWGASAFDNFHVVPPGTGICHQVNLEYLARTVWSEEDAETGESAVYPDTLVGTDSHTTMVNGLSVLGWGVGGIEAEAAMLGQPISMLIPEVIGFRVSGRLREGVTATDLVLTVTEMLRRAGVVGKFVEFYGQGLANLPLEDRATIANMAPEYGATCGFFPVDKETLAYLDATGREPAQVTLVEAYAKAQGLFREADTPDPVFTETLELDLDSVVPSIAGPKRPQDRVPLTHAAASFADALHREYGKGAEANTRVPVEGKNFDLGHGDVVIAAITSCTNTSNPFVMIGAGLLARNAVARGLMTKPWVKTSLAPGSQVVSDYLEAAGVQDDLDTLGFNLVGYGCTTCIGNSGPLPEEISHTIHQHGLAVASVLSGNRNFEGRVNHDVRANYLASPPLVVAYALAGSVMVDLATDPIGTDQDGNAVYLKDIWPSSTEIADFVRKAVQRAMYRKRYDDVFKGDEDWRKIAVKGGLTYDWDKASTYVQNPPYFTDMSVTPDAVTDIEGARILGLFGDSITTDHISPAGAIRRDSPAGLYLTEHGVDYHDFNSYGPRRGNHEVMMRGTFANIRIKNKMVPGVEGGVTLHQPSGERMAIYDAAMRYMAEGVPLVVFAGSEYGTGSSRDWAAKGPRLLGVRAVVAQSFERIHRSNLIGMGVLPLVFADGTTWEQLGLTGAEVVSIGGLTDMKPGQWLEAEIVSGAGEKRFVPVRSRIDTFDELDYFRNGGILHYVLRGLASEGARGRVNVHGDPVTEL